MTSSSDTDRQYRRLLVLGAVPLLLGGSVTSLARVGLLASTGCLWGAAGLQWINETREPAGNET